MSPTTNSVTPSIASPAPAAATSTPADPLGNESTFLQLLVSQLQNQDPLNPTDSSQFVSQLTSYSQLEQLINIDQNTAPVTPTTGATQPTTSQSTTPAV